MLEHFQAGSESVPISSLDHYISSVIEQLKLVFSNKEYYKRLLAFKESRAQRLLDGIQLVLDSQREDGDVQRQLIVAMQRLATTFGLCPTGAFSDIYKGSYQGRVVAVKILRIYWLRELGQLMKTTSKEAVLWRQLSHPNVLPFYGVFPFRGRLSDTHAGYWIAADVACGLTYLHDHGIVVGNMKSANILVDSAYRAVVSGFGLFSISDASIMGWTSQSQPSSRGGSVRWQAPELLDIETDEPVHNTAASDIYAWGCVCFELFTGDIPFAGITRDATVFFYVRAGQCPSRPAMSHHAWHQWGLTSELWALMERCWSWEPARRPLAAEISEFLAVVAPTDTRSSSGDAILSFSDLRRKTSETHDVQALVALYDILSEILNPHSNAFQNLVNQEVTSLIARLSKIIADREQYRRLLDRRDRDAQQLLDIFQYLLDVSGLNPDFRRKLIAATQKLSSLSQLYPAHYELKNVAQTSESPLAGGAFGDIFKGKYENQVVCLKVMRSHQKEKIDDFFKKVSKEVILWAQLSHSNVLAIYGIYYLRSQICIVSPWIDHGNIREYLQHNPGAARRRLAADVANGLVYLHEEGIIHGDLKSQNILVDNTGRALLADFGISSVLGNDIVILTLMSAVGSRGGTLPYQAPELIDFENDNIVTNTTKSDIYAWGCVCFEVPFISENQVTAVDNSRALKIFTREIPFADTAYLMILLKIKGGSRPKRPAESSSAWKEWGLTQDLWSIIENCWKEDPSHRPSATDILDSLVSQLSNDTRPSISSGTPLLQQRRHQMSEPLEMGKLEAINHVLLVVEGKAEDIESFPQKTTNPEIIDTLHDGHITKDDSIILTLGQTGVGKSTFINYLSEKNVMSVGDGLEAQTKVISHHVAADPRNKHRRMFLVDTPGFDDDDVADREVLDRIIEWLKNNSGSCPDLRVVIIYLVDIEQTRRIFKAAISPIKLLAAGLGAHLVVSSTKWSLYANEQVPAIRQAQLKRVCSCEIHRFGDSTEAARSIINMGLQAPVVALDELCDRLDSLLPKHNM